MQIFISQSRTLQSGLLQGIQTSWTILKKIVYYFASSPSAWEFELNFCIN